LTLAVVAMGAPSAHADVETPLPDALQTYWDGPTLNLNWEGQVYTTVSGTFVGTPVAVPGDQTRRTLNVRNDGPCPANLTVEVVEAVTTVPEGSVNREAEDLVHLRWDVNGTVGGDVFSAIVGSQPRTLATVPVARAGIVPVAIGYEFPIEATTGKNLGRPSTVLSFEVRLVLRGEACDVPEPTPTGSALSRSQTPRPSGSKTAGGIDDSRGPSALPQTGTRIAGIAAPVAVGLVVVGAILFGVRRRRGSDSAPGTGRVRRR
jgi:hypothetical protein